MCAESLTAWSADYQIHGTACGIQKLAAFDSTDILGEQRDVRILESIRGASDGVRIDRGYNLESGKLEPERQSACTAE